MRNLQTVLKVYNCQEHNIRDFIDTEPRSLNCTSYLILYSGVQLLITNPLLCYTNIIHFGVCKPQETSHHPQKLILDAICLNLLLRKNTASSWLTQFRTRKNDIFWLKHNPVHTYSLIFKFVSMWQYFSLFLLFICSHIIIFSYFS